MNAEAIIEVMCRAVCAALGEDPDEQVWQYTRLPYGTDCAEQVPRWKRDHYSFCRAEYLKTIAQDALAGVREVQAMARAQEAMELAKKHGWKEPNRNAQ